MTFAHVLHPQVVVIISSSLDVYLCCFFHEKLDSKVIPRVSASYFDQLAANLREQVAAQQFDNDATYVREVHAKRNAL